MTEDKYPIFTALLTELGYPPEREGLFWPGRKYVWDYVWREAKLALDVQGGVYAGGHHTRGKGYTDDCIKSNEALLMGWRVLRVTPQMLTDGQALRWVLRALGGEE